VEVSLVQDAAGGWTAWIPLVQLLEEREGASLAWLMAVENALAQVLAASMGDSRDDALVELLREWRKLERELCFHDAASGDGIELRLHVECCRRAYRDTFQARVLLH
jgi:hypothetical protein